MLVIRRDSDQSWFAAREIFIFMFSVAAGGKISAQSNCCTPLSYGEKQQQKHQHTTVLKQSWKENNGKRRQRKAAREKEWKDRSYEKTGVKRTIYNILFNNDCGINHASTLLRTLKQWIFNTCRFTVKNKQTNKKLNKNIFYSCVAPTLPFKWKKKVPDLTWRGLLQTPRTGLRHPSFAGRCRKVVLGVEAVAKLSTGLRHPSFGESCRRAVFGVWAVVFAFSSVHASTLNHHA